MISVLRHSTGEGGRHILHLVCAPHATTTAGGVSTSRTTASFGNTSYTNTTTTVASSSGSSGSASNTTTPAQVTQHINSSDTGLSLLLTETIHLTFYILGTFIHSNPVKITLSKR